MRRAIVVQSLATFMSLGLNKLFGLHSEVYVAVLGAYFKLQNFLYMVVYGLGNAVVPIISFNYGARSRTRVTGTIRAAMFTALVSMCVGMILMLAIPKPLLMLFSLSPEALAIGVPAMRIVSLSFLPAGASLVISYVFQATGSNSSSLVLALLRQIVVLLPLAALLLYSNPACTWWAFPVAEGCCLILAIFLFRRSYRRRIAPLEDRI